MTPPVLNQAAWVQRAQALQLGNYAPAPIVLTEGRGSEVWDHAGRRYLDFAGGIAVLSVGHSHPRLSDAISAQAQRLMHVSNLFYNDRAIALAETLTAVSGYARVYFCNSGAEANETLIKLARRWHHDQGRPERTRIVAAHGSFHGRTLGALSVTGQSKYHHGFGPLLPDVDFVPFGDVAALEQTLQDRTAALLLEPIQAEGGIIVGSDAYLQAAQALCRARGVLLFFDEVQTGVGRTGRFLAQAHAGVQADACALAKGLGGGFPIGAVLVQAALAEGLPVGSHASTFGGNPLACAAAAATLQILHDEQLVARAAAAGRRFGAALADLAARHPGRIVAVRGRGLLCGLQLAADCPVAGAVAALRDQGVLVTAAGDNVLRLTPPLNTPDALFDEALTQLEAWAATH